MGALHLREEEREVSLDVPSYQTSAAVNGNDVLTFFLGPLS